MVPTDPSQADPSIVALMSGIKNQESGFDYTKMGDKDAQGEYTAAGVGQWSNQDANGNPQPLQSGQIPTNFQADAKQYGLDPTDFSPANQNKVMYARISDRKAQGYSPEQIASEWNSGDKNKYLTENTTQSGSVGNYNVAQYVQNVMKYAQQYAQKNQSTTGTDSQTGTTYPMPDVSGLEKYQQTQTPTTSTGDKGFLGDLESGNLGGAASNAVINTGDALTFGGASQLGNAMGTGAANLYDMAMGRPTSAAPSMSQTLSGAGKVIGGGLLAGGTGLLEDAVRGAGSVLANPELVKVITSLDSPATKEVGDLGETLKSGGKMTMEQFSKMTASDKLDFLSDALKTAKESNKGLIQKAIQELKPLSDVEKGIAPSLLKKIGQVLGNATKGLLHSGVAGGIGYALGNGAIGNTAKNIYSGIFK